MRHIEPSVWRMIVAEIFMELLPRIHSDMMPQAQAVQ